MGDISFGEIIVILVVGLILFGPNKIPEFARQCGRAVNMFKKGLKEGFDDESKSVSQSEKTEKTEKTEGKDQAPDTKSLPHQ
ncbi:MAG: twin-arginine translocase TatA/TatE family subunit [Elusimicrobia bacterium]|nr:twin-arginine translocase TatA/TatE family subunit [Elusimicrobiota bacterium]MDE2313222.1 twin-arginine translocase TatA/TatE family subunit [Elusimicrobiota bacterium]